MEESPNLDLPYILPSQAQKHVTHNEAIRRLDALVQMGVLDSDRTSPPAAPAEGDRHIVAAEAAGEWAGRGNMLAAWQNGGWTFYAPRGGWLAYDLSAERALVFDGAAWQPLEVMPEILQNVALFGLGTTADEANPFAVKANTALWTAQDAAAGGDGDLRFTFNKEGPGDVLSLLFQSGYSARAELGLIGDDDLTLKTSPDGAAWYQALRVDAASGGIDATVARREIAAAAICDLGAAGAMHVAVTGSAAISSFGTRANALRLVHFIDAPTLVHDGAQFVLPGGADIAVEPGDCALAASDAAGAWRVLIYQRASGRALTPPAPEDGAAAGGRRNAFINPFFDVAQGYEAPIVVNGFGLVKLPIDMAAFSGISGGEWNISLVPFEPGQTDVPGEPERFLRIEQPLEPASGYPYLRFVAGPVRTLAGREFTVSFYGRVPSGTCAIALQCNQYFGSGGSPAAFNVPIFGGITLTTAWQRFTFTDVLGDITGKTIGPGDYLELRIGVSNTGKLRGDFCGVQIEPGAAATPVNPLPRGEAELLCRRYYERVAARTLVGSRPVACLPKRATPSISTTLGAVANASANECILTHDAAADAVVTFDARLG